MRSILVSMSVAASLLGLSAIAAAQLGKPPPCSAGEHADCGGPRSSACWCVANTPLPRPPVPTISYADPDYVLMAIIYAPPGRRSTADYGQGSTAGSQTQSTLTNQYGGIAQSSTSVGEVDFKATTGPVSGNVWGFSKSTNTHWTLTAPDESDAENTVNHMKDQFYLLMDAEYVMADDGAGHRTTTLRTVNDAPSNVVTFTLEELMGSVPVPPEKQGFLNTLDGEERFQIMTVDPWFTLAGGPNYTPTLDPNRFAMLNDVFELEGPDNPGDLIPGVGQDVGYNTSTGTIDGTQSSQETDVLFGIDVSFIVKGSLKVGADWSWTYTNQTQTTNQTQQMFTMNLSTETPCYYQDMQVWYDAAFGTYAYIPAGPIYNSCSTPAPVSGQVTAIATGQPVANMPVVATLPNGTTRTAFTNQQGVYRMYDVGTGTVAPHPQSGAMAVMNTVLTNNFVPPTPVQPIAVGGTGPVIHPPQPIALPPGTGEGSLK